MKIVCGVKNIKEAIWAFNNGVSEIYFSYRLIPNHRRNELSVSTFQEAAKIIKLSLEQRCSASLVYNGDDVNYSVNYIKKVIYPCILAFQSLGLKSIILKDIVIMNILRKMGLKLNFSLSSLSLVFNSYSLEIFKKLNISRVVMPLHLSPSESKKLIKNIQKRKIETEFFYYPTHNCQNVDPLCRFCDSNEKGCKILYNGNFFMPYPSDEQMGEYFYYNFINGADYIKIARTMNFEKVKKAVNSIKYLTNLINNGVELDIFVKKFFKIADISLSV